MERAGIKPVEPIADNLGKGLVRFRCDGDAPGRRNGWAVLHLDGRPAGAFGNYRLGISDRWRAGSTERLSATERRDLARQWRQAKAEREAERLTVQEATAEDCERLFDLAGPVDPLHPYLVRKGVSGDSLKQLGDKLFVPMRDEAGKLWNLQRIGPDGSKRFAKGGRQNGLFHLIGDPGDMICIAEGFATAASVRRATGHAVAVAFSAGNLKPVAVAMRERFPDAEIVVCADDDAHLVDHPTIKRNLGVEAAENAARAVGGRIAMPPRERN